jgi:hypothetical protein
MPGGAHEWMKTWEPEEDDIILNMYENLGAKWKQIVQQLPGRTISSVRNRFQRIEKGRTRPPGRNRCQACGHPKRGHICRARTSSPRVALPVPITAVVPLTSVAQSGLAVTIATAAGATAATTAATSPSNTISTTDRWLGKASSPSAEAPSFFQDLSGRDDLFPQDLRDQLSEWAAAAPQSMQQVAMDASAPPSLRRAASADSQSGGGTELAFNLTRSVSSYLREVQQRPDVSSDIDFCAPMPHTSTSFGGDPSASAPLPPLLASLSRQPSLSSLSIPPFISRSQSSFINELLDKSGFGVGTHGMASIVSLPSRGGSFDLLDDVAPTYSAISEAMPPISRRSSARLAAAATSASVE